MFPFPDDFEPADNSAPLSIEAPRDCRSILAEIGLSDRAIRELLPFPVPSGRGLADVTGPEAQ